MTTVEYYNNNDRVIDTYYKLNGQLATFPNKVYTTTMSGGYLSLGRCLPVVGTIYYYIRLWFLSCKHYPS